MIPAESSLHQPQAFCHLGHCSIDENVMLGLQQLEGSLMHALRSPARAVQDSRFPAQALADSLRPACRPIVGAFLPAVVGQTAAVPTGEEAGATDVEHGRASSATSRRADGDAQDPALPVRVVRVYRRTHWIALVTTDLTLSVAQIIEI